MLTVKKNMNEKIREICVFEETFSFLRDTPILLYGTGQYTELILQRCRGFKVAGLIDPNWTGRMLYGLPVLSEREIIQSGCKAIIIIANLSAAPIIYQRIKPLAQKYRIACYYMNGRRPAVWNPTEEPVWIQDKEKLLAAAEKADVISFDLFDTLIMRRCLFPEEVFSISARGISEPEMNEASVVLLRQQAEKTLYHSGKLFYSLSDIYKELEGSLGKYFAENLMRLEFDTELNMVIPRTDMVHLYETLLKADKQVVITTDMYLSTQQLQLLQKKCGISNSTLYISNEQRASKYIGTLFQKLQNDFPGKCILHIGDNLLCDVKNAQKAGIAAIQIPSAEAQMSFYGLDQLKQAARNDAERHMYELFAQKCFRNVFRKKEQSRILLEDPQEIGYLFFGPLAVGYLAWLLKQLDEKRIEHILFISRDGYIFHRLYRRLQKLYNGLPEASYFLTSRRCAGNAAIMCPEDVRFVFEDVCYSRGMCVKDMLNKVYGISADSLDPIAGHTLGELGSAAVWEHLQKEYMGVILQHAVEERASYKKYIEKLDLKAQRIGMMNFVGRGVTQRCLTKIMGKDLTGFYFAMEYGADNILGETGKELAVSWYSEPFSTHTSKQKLAEQMLLGETVFSAPHGAVVAFSEQGEPLYEPTSQIRGDFVKACQNGIMEYFEDIIQLEKGLDQLNNTVEMADAIFGLLRDSRFMISKSIEETIQFEDRFQ